MHGMQVLIECGSHSYHRGAFSEFDRAEFEDRMA